MSSDQFTVEDQKKSGSGCTGWIIGCLVVCLILAAIACGVGYWIYSNAGGWAADFAETAINDAIDESELPEEQKVAMKEQVSRLTQGYRDGDVTLEQLAQIGEKLQDSPVMTAIPVEVVRSTYLAKSGLTEEQKAEATKQLQRVAHGMFEKKITEEELKTLIDGRLGDVGPDGEIKFRNDVSDEELLEFTKAAKELADSKDIPDQNYEIDFAAELKKAVDEVLLGHSNEIEDIDIDLPELPPGVGADAEAEPAEANN